MCYFDSTKILVTSSKDKSIKFWELPVSFRESDGMEEEEH